MRKQELIHLHGLLVEVATFCMDEDDIAIELDEYQSLGTHPTSIHLSKTDHKHAVFALINGITAAVQEELARPEEPVSAKAD